MQDAPQQDAEVQAPGGPAPGRPEDSGGTGTPLGFSPEELQQAFAVTHRRAGATSGQLLDVTTKVYALAQVLVGKGVVGLDELDTASRTVEQRMLPAFDQANMAVSVESSGVDKYALGDESVQIDCASRLPLCRGACCRLRFPLSLQDVDEGVVQWDLSLPFYNRQGRDGYCVHLDRADLGCTVYENRPVICRTYDCRRDQRIWLDFEARVVNPALTSAVPPVAAEEARATPDPRSDPDRQREG